MGRQTAISFVEKEIKEYNEYLYKYKTLDEFYKGTRNIITFRLEQGVYSITETQEALNRLDKFYREQEEMRKQQNNKNNGER